MSLVFFPRNGVVNKRSVGDATNEKDQPVRKNDIEPGTRANEHSAASAGYVACFECGDVTETHDHHVVPASRGGKKTMPLCLRCHGLAHGRPGSMATSDLTREAMARKIARRERVGQVPYGFDLAGDGTTLVENAGELRVVLIMKSLRQSGKSWHAIARELTSRGIPTKHGRPKWRHTAVKGIVDRST